MLRAMAVATAFAQRVKRVKKSQSMRLSALLTIRNGNCWEVEDSNIFMRKPNLLWEFFSLLL